MASTTYSDAVNLLGAGDVKGDENAELYSKFDIGGNLLWDFDGQAKNKAIQQRIGQLEALKGKITLEQRQRLEEGIAKNSGEWNKLTTDILGADGQKLHDFYDELQGEEAQNIQDLEGVFGQYQDEQDLFRDPRFFGDVGDVENQAIASEATKANQRNALAQMQAQTSAQETAAERFQRLMAQQTADANMQGQREAIARDLKARGVYGSGAEVAMNMMSQASEANRRYMADLAANAQAQERASKMLGMSADMASQMRGQEVSEGNFANQVSQFNNTQNQATSNQRSASLQKARGTDNQADRTAGTTIYDAKGRALNTKRGDKGNIIGTQTGLTKGGIELDQAGRTALNQSDDLLRGDIEKEEARQKSQQSGGGLLG